MKRSYILPSLFFSVISLAVVLHASMQQVVKKSTGSHPSSTGAPGDSTCAAFGCHVDAFAVSGDSVNSILFNGKEELSYENDSTYELDIAINNPTGKRFGFEVVALDKNDSNCGSFTVPIGIKTPRVQTLMDNGRIYGTHTQAGITPLSPGIDAWQILWNAPSHYTGPVTFYYATLAANANNLASGDRIFLSSKTVHAVGSTIETEQQQDNTLSARFKASSELEILCPEHWSGSPAAQLSIYAMDGRLVFLHDIVFSDQACVLSGPSQLPSGAYILRLRSQGRLAGTLVLKN